MKIGILGFRKSLKQVYEETRLVREAKAMGHKAMRLCSSNFQMVYDKKTPVMLYSGKKFAEYDVLIVKPSYLEDIELSLFLLKQIEELGYKVFNDYSSIINAKNKVRSMQILNHYGIPMPRTVVVQRSEDIEQASKLVGAFPLIIKVPMGSFGNGVSIVESMRALRSFLQKKRFLYIFQEYVKYANGKDIRVFVLGGKVLATMQRNARKGEFRANIHQGGYGMPIKITDEEENMALRSAQAMGLHFAGVDILRGREGPVVLEVNSNPGFQGLEESTGVNIAGAMINYAIEFAERHKA